MAIPAFREDGWLPEGHWPATWEEVIDLFDGQPGSRRAALTRRLLALRTALQARSVPGRLVLDGSYVSDKPDPGDFDVLLIGPSDLQVRKDNDPVLGEILDTEAAEKSLGYSLFYMPEDSPVLDLLRSMWDISKQGTPKGVVELEL